MSETIRLSRSDIRRLRATAEALACRSSSAARFAIEVAERCSLTTGARALNIRAISGDPEWADTDLFTTHPWSSLRDRHPLAGGAALFDLYGLRALRHRRRR